MMPPHSSPSLRSTIRLGVNIDHVATLRQARRGALPDPVEAARVCERAGAASIVCHLREDRRHIQDEDVRRLKDVITTRFNLELSMASDIVRVALAVRPDQVTLVPERRQELTTEGGLDVITCGRKIARLVRAFATSRIRVSLFIDPVRSQLEAARDSGITIVELHTGHFANATTPQMRAKALGALQHAAAIGTEWGLEVAAGHGLDGTNVQAVAAIPQITELNIGFSIITRALTVGLASAVQEMVALIPRPGASPSADQTGGPAKRGGEAGRPRIRHSATTPMVVAPEVPRDADPSATSRLLEPREPQHRRAPARGMVVPS